MKNRKESGACRMHGTAAMKFSRAALNPHSVPDYPLDTVGTGPRVPPSKKKNKQTNK
jgi:hypothetical protein